MEDRHLRRGVSQYCAGKGLHWWCFEGTRLGLLYYVLVCWPATRRRRRSQRQVRRRLRRPHPFAQAKTAAAPLPDPQTPEEFFARARALSDLEASGTPFHLKATYVASGDAEFTGNGTYEEWWQSKDLWRKEATLGNLHVCSYQRMAEMTKRLRKLGRMFRCGCGRRWTLF